MKPKPAHLGVEYAQQFEDRSVARAYRARPPYPAAVFDLLAQLIVAQPRHVLELGAGTGDLTFGLAERVDRVEAVEASRSMIDAARTPAHGAPNVTWVHSPAESHRFGGPYAAVVAAESLHWMDWELVFPRVARTLAPDGRLILVLDRTLMGLPWESRLTALIARYSTNQEYRAYDLVAELRERGLFAETGRARVGAATFAQSVDDYVESFHSRNGFSRERMGARADEFDRELRELIAADTPEQRIEAKVASTVVWGTVLGRRLPASGLPRQPDGEGRPARVR